MVRDGTATPLIYSPRPRDARRGYRQLHVQFLREYGIDGFERPAKQRRVDLDLNGVR